MSLTAVEAGQLVELNDKIMRNLKEAQNEMRQSGEYDKMDPVAKAKVDALVYGIAESKRGTDGNIEEQSDVWKKTYLENKKTGFETQGVEDYKYIVDSRNVRQRITNINSLIQITTKEPHIRMIHEKQDDLYILGRAMSFTTGVPVVQVIKGLNLYDELMEDLSEYRKALGTATSGEGADWIPTGFSGTMIDEVRLQLLVATMHQRIPMPTNPYTLPIKVGRSTAYRATEATVDAPSELRKSQLQTSNSTFDAETIAVATPFSYEFEEDSIVPVLPIVRQDVALALAEAQENATVNGDTATTHQYTGLTVETDDQLKLWDGYVKSCLSTAKVDFNTGTEDFSTANFRAIRKAMGKYGVRPSDLVWDVSINAYIRMLGLSEVITLDKYGSMATVLSGELARFDNIPVAVSEFVRTDLNASGIYDGTTTTKTIALLVHRPSWRYGERREITIELVKLPLSQQNVMISTQRIDLQPVRPVATEAIVGMGYDIDS